MITTDLNAPVSYYLPRLSTTEIRRLLMLLDYSYATAPEFAQWFEHHLTMEYSRRMVPDTREVFYMRLPLGDWSNQQIGQALHLCLALRHGWGKPSAFLDALIQPLLMYAAVALTLI